MTRRCLPLFLDLHHHAKSRGCGPFSTAANNTCILVQSVGVGRYFLLHWAATAVSDLEVQRRTNIEMFLLVSKLHRQRPLIMPMCIFPGPGCANVPSTPAIVSACCMKIRMFPPFALASPHPRAYPRSNRLIRGMLTVVRRAVPGSTRPRHGAAVAAAGAQQQQSPTLYPTSTAATSSENSSSSSSISSNKTSVVVPQRTAAFSAVAASGSPSIRPSPSTSPSHSYAALPSPRWEGSGGQSSSSGASSSEAFVRPSAPASSSQARSITTRSGGTQQQCRAGGSMPGVQPGRGTDLAVGAVSIVTVAVFFSRACLLRVFSMDDGGYDRHSVVVITYAYQ